MRLIRFFTQIQKVTQTQKGALAVLAVILFLGFVVRLYKINNPIADWHSWRQADTASVTRIYMDEGVNVLYPKYYDISSVQTGIFNPDGYRFVEFPVYNLVHLLFVKLQPKINFSYFTPRFTITFQSTFETAGRFVSIFSALTAAVFLYLIGKRYVGRNGGLLAAFFYLFLPFNIYFTRVILPEPMAVAFGVASMWYFIKFIDDNSYVSLYLSAILFAVAALIKPFAFFYLLPLVYLTFQKYGGVKSILRDRKFLMAADVALIPFFLWRIWINRYPAGIPHFSWMFNGDGIRFRPAFWRWIFGERLGRLILGIWGLVPFVVGILATNKKNLFNSLFFGSMLLYVTIFATASVRHDYYQTFVIPAIALVLAQGAVTMWNPDGFNKWLSRFVVVFSVIMMIGMSAYQVKEDYNINHPEIIAAGEAVDRLTPKSARVIAPYSGDTAFLYQTKRFGWPVVEDSFNTLIARGADYYVSVNLGDPDTTKLIKEYKTVAKTDQYILIDLHSPLR